LKKILKIAGIGLGVMVGLFVLLILAIVIESLPGAIKEAINNPSETVVSSEKVIDEETDISSSELKQPTEKTKKAKEVKETKATEPIVKETTLTEPEPKEESETKADKATNKNEKYNRPKAGAYYVESGDMIIYSDIVDNDEDSFNIYFYVEELGTLVDGQDHGALLSKGDKKDTWVSEDGRFTLIYTSDSTYTIEDTSPKDGYSLAADYAPLSYDDTDTTSEIEFVSASDFRDFIGDENNIGKTVQFQAEVGMTYDGEYLLYVWHNDNMYQICSNIQTSDPMLFDGDIVLFTGTYNGNTVAGNQLSFTTVAIELQ